MGQVCSVSERRGRMNIYVGNLAWQVGEDQLREAFAAHGEVVLVRMVTDRDTGRSRGFAFVEMPNEEEARVAIAALNGADFEGRMLRVNEARPRGERRPGGGRERRGGGRGRRRDEWPW